MQDNGDEGLSLCGTCPTPKHACTWRTPFNNNQSLPEDVVVEIAYHGLPHTSKDFLLMQGFDKQGVILPPYSRLVSVLKSWKNGPKQRRPLLESVTVLSPRNRTRLLTRNRRRLSSVGTTDLISPIVLKTVRRVSLFYNPPVSLEKRNTVRTRRLLLVVLVIINASWLWSLGKVRIMKKRKC